MFEKLNFYTDHFKGSFYRRNIRSIGNDLSMNVDRAMPKNISEAPLFRLPPEINVFHMIAFNMHRNYRMGEHFVCPTQMYNKIPGHEWLVFKDRVTDSQIEYAAKYQDRPQCFSKDKYFLNTFRLQNEAECKAFFDRINSPEYKELIKTDPLQYIIKIGHGVHASLGVFLLDEKEETTLRKKYGDNGENCGKVQQSLLAQTYLGNPLLVNGRKKLDFRAFLLVASMDPLIAYYHDGVMRVSFHDFDKNSTNRAIHITNTHMSDEEVEKAKKEGKTDKEIEQMYFNCDAWMFTTLQKHLLETGRIKDPNWLENSFRPQIKKIMLHLLRMSEKHLLKMPNTYELYGLDMMIDENLNVWFIEANSHPLLNGSTKEKAVLFTKMIEGMFDIMFAYYKSRMKRYLLLIKEMQDEPEENKPLMRQYWMATFKEASKNRLEPEFPISNRNTWVPFIDRNRKGADAYYGLLPEECIDD